MNPLHNWADHLNWSNILTFLLVAAFVAGAINWYRHFRRPKTAFRRRSHDDGTFAVALLLVTCLTACTTVAPGHKGVEVSWGGQTNMNMIYPEGMNGGLHWVWDDMVEYDVREKTLVEKYDFNDAKNMSTGVELSLDFKQDPDRVNLLHKNVTDLETKIHKTLKSAGKEVIPQYTAADLNLHKRAEAEQKLSEILAKELPQFYTVFARVQITDVDIPEGIAKAAESTARQDELNKLALSKALESENNFAAAEWDAKTKLILSQPAMLALKKLEIEALWASKGVSPYGSNNVFGAETAVFRGMK
ncbi:MAG TPA: SPFH domain-containing protein [Flavobacteriales bacterium]|nr:SPFH domain-containing protein [Flavobacteriales bacterium]